MHRWWQLPTHAAGGGGRHGEEEPALWPAPTGCAPPPTAPPPNCADAPVALAMALNALPSVGSAPKRNRQPLTVSCIACRRSKKQCSEELPCSRCLRLGIEDECQAPARMRSARGSRAGQPGAAAQPLAVSCMACRRSKKQCSEELPCSRCLRLGIEDECQAPTRMRSARGSRATSAERGGAAGRAPRAASACPIVLRPLPRVRSVQARGPVRPVARQGAGLA